MLNTDSTTSFLTPVFENIPQVLRERPQWVAWFAAKNPEKPEKPDKILLNPKTGYAARTNNAATWGSFEQAKQYYLSNAGKVITTVVNGVNRTGPISGVGLVLTEGSGLVGIDIDGCIDSQGNLTPEAQQIIDRVGSYTEVSPSGTGVRIFVKGNILKALKNSKKGVEIYKSGRYLTVTGRPLRDFSITENQEALDWLIAEYGSDAHKREHAPVEARPSANAPLDNATLIDDANLLEKACEAKNNDKFRQLYNGNWLGLGYPSQSEADLAFCCMLAFWTGKDAAQMDRLFRSCKLYREKWDEIHYTDGLTYGEVTIDKAIANTTETYTGGGYAAHSPDSSEPKERRILPPPPPVPLVAFPPQVATLLQEASEAFTVPMQIVVACFLAFLACLVGRSRLISIKTGWEEAGNLWLAIVAASGVGKSPCMNAFTRVITYLEYKAKKFFDFVYADYEAELAVYQLQRKLQTKEKAKGKNIDTAALAPPVKPKQRQTTADDITVEALGDILQDNPKGILWLKDELSGMLFDLDKYSSNSSGGTKSRLLSAHSLGPWKTNRASNPSRNHFIPKACISIFGGIQPGMMNKVFAAGVGGVDEESGFLPRFLFIRAVAENPAYWTERTFSQKSQQLLEHIANVLWPWDIECGEDDREIEKIVPVSLQAKESYILWYNSIAEEAFLAQNSALLRKLQAHALRLCLLLHCLDAALAGTNGMEAVADDTMRRALLLADWVKEHQAQCWHLLTPKKNVKQADPIERAIMQAVVEEAARIEADGWKISNTDLFSLVEKTLGMPGLSYVKLGKAASALGLGQCSIGSGRGRTVTPEKIYEFKTTVGTVGTVSIPCAAREITTDGTVGHVSVTVGDASPTVTDSAPTDAVDLKIVEAQCLPTHPTIPTDDLGHNPDVGFNNFDFS